MVTALVNPVDVLHAMPDTLGQCGIDVFDDENPLLEDLEAVQAFAPDQVARLAKLGKQDLAREDERLAAGTGWLPAMFVPPVELTPLGDD